MPPNDPYAGFGKEPTQDRLAVDPYAGFTSATPKAVSSVMDDPDKAGKSVEMANKLQQPPTVIYHDFENANWENKAKQASAFVDPSPYLQNYVNNVPLAASVSNDDWGPLSKTSLAVLNLFPDEQKKRAEANAIFRLPEIEGAVQTAAGRRSLLDIVNDKTIPADKRRDLLIGSSYTYSPLDIALSKLSELYGRGVEAVTGIPAEEAEKSLMGLGGGIKVPIKPSAAVEVEAFLNRARGMQSRAEIDEFLRRRAAGETFDDKTGTWSTDPVKQKQAQDQLKIEYADSAARDLKEAIGAAEETKTRERSPTTFEQFVDSHGDAGKVYIPASKMLELYEAEKKIPLPGDGLFGFIPGLVDKMTLAAESGGEIAVPLSKYIANIDPAVHDKIADGVRVHEDGTTQEEAKTISEDKPESIVSAAIQVEGKIYTGINHGEAAIKAEKAIGKEIDSSVESDLAGFITSKGRYVDRLEALEIADAADQLMTPAEELPVAISENILMRDPNTQTAIMAADREAKAFGITSPKELFTDKFVKDAEALGVTKPMLKDYADLIDRRQEMILEKSVKAAQGEVKKRQTVQWKSDEAEMAQEVTTDFRSRPDLAADRYLRTGDFPDGSRRAKVKFNKEEVEAIAGAGALPKYVTDGEGANLGFVANTFGFASGPDMVNALVALQKDRGSLGPKAHLDKLVKEETAKRMDEKYGSLPTNIAVEASSIALQDYNVDLLSAQWKMLAKMAGTEPPISRANLTKWAEEQFGMAEVGQVGYEGFRRSAEKAGLNAEKALLKGKYNDAFKAKQTQMLNFLLAREAKAFEKTVVKPTEKLIGKYASQVTVPGVDQKFTDIIHALTHSYGVNLVRTRQNIDYNLGGKTVSNFIDEMNQNGALLPKPALPTPGKDVSLDTFTVNEYHDFASLLKSLDYNGRREKQIEVAGKAEERFQAIDKITKNLDSLEKKGFDPTVKGPVSALRAVGRYVDAKLLKAEKLIDWIDHEDPLGPMNTAVLRGLVEGEQDKAFTLNKIAKLIEKAPMSRAWGKNLNQLTDNKELRNFDTGELEKITNENKVVIALNYGNAGNRKVMTMGHHWSEGEIDSFLKRNMTKEDWAAVEFFYGLFKPLAPLVEATTKARSGLAIPLVEPTPFLESKGGYWPLIKNPRDVLLGVKQNTDLFDRTKFDPLPMAPALKTRTGSVYRLDFSLNRVHSIISQTVHAVHLQEPVVNANKVISDPLVREGIANGFGPEYVKLLDEWIRDIANNGGQNDDALASWMSRNVRENVVTMLMGYKISTALIHGGSAGAASLYELGKMHLQEKGAKSFVLAPAELIKNIRALGLDQFLPEEARRLFANGQNLLSTYEEVMSKSRELPNRQRALQKDFGYQLNKIVNKNIIDDATRLRAIYHAYSMSMVAYLDLLTATPVWKAAEAKALADGHESDDAIYIADKAVREAHGSSSLIARANVGRGEIRKWITIAYNGYWNHNYNKSREFANIMTGRAGGGGPPAPPGVGAEGFQSEDPDPQFTLGMKLALGAGFVTAMFVAPALVHHAIRGDEAETTEEAILGMMASQAAGQIPVINSMMYAMIHNRDPSISPIEEVMKAVTYLERDVAKFIKGGEPKRPISHATKAIGFTLGTAPTNQLIDLISFMYDVANDEQAPEGVGQWLNGILTGKAERRQHR